MKIESVDYDGRNDEEMDWTVEIPEAVEPTPQVAMSSMFGCETINRSDLERAYKLIKSPVPEDNAPLTPGTFPNWTKDKTRQLLEFQLVGLEEILRRTFGGILGDEMGLGKVSPLEFPLS